MTIEPRRGAPRKIGPSLRSPTARSTARAVRGASGTVTILPPLRTIGEGAVAAFETELFDVGADRFGHPQAVEREQAEQRMVAGVAEPGGDEHGADLVAVEAGGVRLVVEARAAHVHRGRHRDEAFLFGVAVEARDRAQPARDRGPSPTERLEVTGERLDVGATRTEQRDPTFGAPCARTGADPARRPRGSGRE